MTGPILLVEDTPSLSMVYEAVIRKAGHRAACVFTVSEAREEFAKNNHKIILLDLLLPDGDGMELMSEFITTHPDIKVIVITANGSINRAVEAMRLGAFDFLVKPFDETRLLSAVDNARKALASDVAHPLAEGDDTGQFQGFIGSSDAMQGIYKMVRNIGRSTATVFVTGESGTGKELCAQAIHDVSSRAKGPFVPLNCGAIPRGLLESEVFGHLKGSFTGAIADKKGAAAAASGGTLFLDEICEMDLSLQTKLLRFLQTSTIQPVGATKAQMVDVRIVCATNRDPLTEVRAGRFREDLYYRLHVVPIHLPPLRERDGDIMLIADKVLAKFAVEENKNFTGFSPEVRDIFTSMAWPGNVRQMMNAIRNVVVLNDGHTVLPEMLPSEVTMPNQMSSRPRASLTSSPDAMRTEGQPNNVSAFIGTPLATFEREFIEATIDFCEGSIPQAARLLDVSPSTLYRKKESWEKS
ncbi:sigma-54-dependent Fis family transcriptional regulator [Rhodobacterales bacterium 52_120_T64]|nr:sigma-54-dependent Fis family transcriptional regulator [Rhodobacterales bacterium 52_120_T64]